MTKKLPFLNGNVITIITKTKAYIYDTSFVLSHKPLVATYSD